MKKTAPDFVDPRVELVDIPALQTDILKIYPEWEKRTKELGPMLYWLREALKDKEPRRKGTGFKAWCEAEGLGYDKCKYLADQYEPPEVKQEKEQRKIARLLTKQLQTPKGNGQAEKKEISFSKPWEMQLDVFLVARLGDHLIGKQETLKKKLEIGEYLAQHFQATVDRAEHNQRFADLEAKGKLPHQLSGRFPLPEYVMNQMRLDFAEIPAATAESGSDPFLWSPLPKSPVDSTPA